MIIQDFKKRLACLLTGVCCVWAVPALGGDIYVYEGADGSRLITDHPRMEPGYHLLKVYSENKIWRQAVGGPAPRLNPGNAAQYDSVITSAARRVSLDPLLIKSVMHAESAFDPNAVSRRGASGLMQLMPGTASRYGVSRIFDPHQNVLGGARYLSDLLDMFDGNLSLALAGYNAGENAVLETGGIPPYSETRRYVRKVIDLYRDYQDEKCQQQKLRLASVEGSVISCSASFGTVPEPSSRSTASTTAAAATMAANTLSSADDSQDRQWRVE